MNTKRMNVLAMVLLAAAAFSVSGNAAVTTFNPNPINLQNLPHEYYFTWGINYNLAQDEYITGAKLTFSNIWDWTKENNDTLFVHLLDNPKAGVKAIKDNQKGGDNFKNQGTMVGTWSDPKGGKPTNFNLVFDFAQLGLLDELTAYIGTPYGNKQANFGFGIDPDCHYYNNGVCFEITTAIIPQDPPTPPTIVPVPGAVSLGGIGIAFVGWLRSRKQ